MKREDRRIRKETVLSSISDSIAAMFLKDALEKGCGIEIPSLGIKIDGSAISKRVEAQKAKD